MPRLRLHTLRLLTFGLCGPLLAQTLTAQSSGKTVRKHRETVVESVSALVSQAEDALGKNDYTGAETLLKKTLSANPQDYRAWFDLGYVYRATQRPKDAIEAYRKSLAIKKDVFESNLDLGLLLLAAEDHPQAAQYLADATKLTPSSDQKNSLARAWNALGLALAERPSKDAALDAFRQAELLNAQDPAPHLSAGRLLEGEKQFTKAEAEYKSALNLHPNSQDAISGLVNVYTKSNRLEEAEIRLRDYLRLYPTNPSAHLQMARLLRKKNKDDEAVSELSEALKSDPHDTDLLRELAALLAATKKYQEAAGLYQTLVSTSSPDAELRHEFGVVLMQMKNFAQAESELLQALKLDPKLTAAYGDLALAASENKHYGLTIQALDARAKTIPEQPGTYFLRATAYDNLKSYQEAIENYRHFLAVANGKYPEQEWQARHRLMAIDDNRKKK